MTPGLKRIITINSKPHGHLLSEFDFNGSTRVTGSNGAGKTSLLKLIPFFFGADRKSIIGGAAHPFTKWYLPNTNSYIIFEYVTNRTQLAHVIITKEPNKAGEMSYRFVDGPFINSVIIKDSESGLSQAIPSNELIQSLLDHSLNYSKAITSISTYRSIIQNLNSSSWPREFTPYSLCSGTRNIKHVEKISIALLQGEFSMENSKRLLIEIIGMQDNDIKLGINLEQVESWCNDYQGISSFAKYEQDFADVVRNNNVIIANSTYLFEARKEFADRSEIIRSEVLPQLTAEKNRLEVEREKALLQLQELHAEEVELQSTSKIKARTLIQALSYNDEQKNSYIDQGMAEIATDFSSLSKKREELRHRQGHFNKLEIEIDNIDDHFTKIEMTLSRTKQTTINDIENDLRDKERAYESEKATLGDTHNAEKEQLNKVASKKSDSIRKSKEALLSLRGSLRSSLENPAANEKLIQELEKLEELKADSQQAFSNHQKDLISVGKQEAKERSETDSLLTKIAEANKSIESLESEIERLSKLLDPSSETLVAFLNEHSPNWENQPIGKILNPDILLDTRMKPELCQESDLLFGIGIETGHLPPSSFTTVEMQERLTKQVRECDRLIQERDNLNTNATKLKKTLKETRARLSQVQTACDQSEKDVELHTQNIESKKVEILQSKEQNRIAAEKAFSVNETDIKQIETELSEIASQLQTNLEVENNTHLELKSDLDTTFEQEKETLLAQKRSAIATYDNSLALLKKEIKARRDKAGISDELFKEYKQEIKALEVKIETLENSEDDIRDYHAWQRTQETVIAEQRQEVKVLHETLQTSEHTSAKLQSEITKVRREFKSQLDEVKAQEKFEDTNLNRFESCIQKIDLQFVESDLGDLEFSFSGDYTTLVHSTLAKLEDIRTLKTTRSRQIHKLEEITRSWGTGELLTFWQSSIASNEQGSDNSKIAVLDRIITEVLPTVTQTVITQSMNIGSMISNFRDGLKTIEQLIKAEGRRITSEVRKFNDFEIIDSIEITINSTLKRLAGWQDIDDFAKIFSEYDSTTKQHLPPLKFYRALQTASTHIGQSNNHDIADLFEIQFDITENGTAKIARTNHEMKHLSSNGTNLLIQTLLYTAMINSQRTENNVSVCFPIDEADKLASQNLEKLVALLRESNINMVAAMPNGTPQTTSLFDNLYQISKRGIITNKPSPTELQKAILKTQSSEVM
ncbi:ATP-binding protein [Vibrio inusitatus NBRC 102082]|uniref:ATP-binding protein n=1 Tax=Vibrio inusitatus NBRC 102082 TaxID=1219070 RepID=A0A4Y3HZ68_9VIBR|nr:ATP-binding protein [Vibrio inusitatus]GEA52318.1 ATP-binding protein [Vibrio inusitatus NBRC 102082]